MALHLGRRAAAAQEFGGDLGREATAKGHMQGAAARPEPELGWP